MCIRDSQYLLCNREFPGISCNNKWKHASRVSPCYRDSRQGLAQARTLARCSRKKRRHPQVSPLLLFLFSSFLRWHDPNQVYGSWRCSQLSAWSVRLPGLFIFFFLTRFTIYFLCGKVKFAPGFVHDFKTADFAWIHRYFSCIPCSLLTCLLYTSRCV